MELIDGCKKPEIDAAWLNMAGALDELELKVHRHHLCLFQKEENSHFEKKCIDLCHRYRDTAKYLANLNCRNDHTNNLPNPSPAITPSLNISQLTSQAESFLTSLDHVTSSVAGRVSQYNASLKKSKNNIDRLRNKCELSFNLFNEHLRSIEDDSHYYDEALREVNRTFCLPQHLPHNLSATPLHPDEKKQLIISDYSSTNHTPISNINHILIHSLKQYHSKIDKKFKKSLIKWSEETTATSDFFMSHKALVTRIVELQEERCRSMLIMKGDPQGLGSAMLSIRLDAIRPLASQILENRIQLRKKAHQAAVRTSCNHLDKILVDI